MVFLRQILGCLALGLTACGSAGDKDLSANIAVATNFYSTAKKLEADFETVTAFDIILSSGSSGQLYAQIINGAPYDIFLSADQARPAALIKESFAKNRKPLTYAIGGLALWSPTKTTMSAETLTTPFRKLAIANPDLAPYGRAAMETLKSLNLDTSLKAKIVKGENIGQTYSLVSTGNAELGFIAFSQVQKIEKGGVWSVPSNLHSPINQDAVLLNPQNPAAKAFYDYLQSEPAKAIITQDGYGAAHAG